MQKNISFQIRWIGSTQGMAKSLTDPSSQTVVYNGEELVLSR
jgi:hypothetical protein